MPKQKNYILAVIMICATATLISIYSSPAQESGKKKVISIDTNKTCITTECHAVMGNKKYIHKVGINPKYCSKCHEIAEEGKHIFKPLSQIVSSLCAQCHDKNTRLPSDIIRTPPRIDFSGEGMKLHKPFKEGKCTVCHDAHESDYYRHLKAQYPQEPYATYSPDTYKLCFNEQCHQGYGKILETPRILTGTGFRNGNLNLHYKHVNKKKGRTCRVCHRHHGSEFPDLMTKSFKFGARELPLEFKRTDTGGSCITSCHRRGSYDRYEPVFNPISSTPTPGRNATAEELKQSRERDLKMNVPQQEQK